MVSTRLSTIAVMVTGTTLLLQLIILFRTQCQVSISQLETRKVSETIDTKLPDRGELLEKVLVTAETKKSDINFPVAAKRERTRRLTFGIPTVKRRDGSYFNTMFETMLNKTTPQQLKDIVFVILLAETANVTWKLDITQYLNRKYHHLVESGSLIVIEPPVSIYSSMPDYRNDSYMLWRTKQNFDYAFIMKYSQYLSEYYMQMEDDVITSDGYYDAIMNYIKDMNNTHWVCMEFSELGFIGKLYHSRDIGHLADLLLMFNSTMPVDYTFVYFNILAGQNYKLMRKPTLFQHMGVASSLADKVQLLKDKFFDFKPKEIKGDNPSAKMFTTLKIMDDFPPALAYSADVGYFWSGGAPTINDTFTVVFTKPQSFSRIAIVSGSVQHPEDKLHAAILESSPYLDAKTGEECTEYVPLGEFYDGNIDLTSEVLKEKMSFKAYCLRIRILKPQIQWVIIKEIAVFT